MGERMILTCHACPRQICAQGKSATVIDLARLFGWTRRPSGDGFFCLPCGGAS
jgi:hypothetical protein